MNDIEDNVLSGIDEVAALSPGGDFLAIKIGMLDLGKIKERVGDRWEHSQRTIRLIIEGVLRREITGADRWRASEAGEYYLFLANSSEEVAGRRCKAILDRLVTKLFGAEEIDEKPRFRGEVMRLGQGALTGTAAQRREAFLASSKLLTIQSDSAEAIRTATAAKSRQKLLEDELTIIASEDIGRLIRRAEKETPSWQMEHSGAADRKNSAAVKKAAEATKGVTSSKDLGEIDYDFSYTPIWDVPKRALLCYRLNFSIRMPRGKTLDSVSPIFASQCDRATIQAIDRLRVKKALGGLMRDFLQGRKYIISIPVSAQSCSDRWGVPTIFDQFSGLPKEFGKLIIIDLIDGSWPEFRPDIGEITATINKFCRQAFIRVDQDHYEDLLSASVARPVGVGVDLGDDETDQRHFMKFVDRLAGDAAPKKASVFVWGVNARSTAMMSIASGADYVCGDAVAADVPDPGGISKLSFADYFV